MLKEVSEHSINDSQIQHTFKSLKTIINPLQPVLPLESSGGNCLIQIGFYLNKAVSPWWF